MSARVDWPRLRSCALYSLPYLAVLAVFVWTAITPEDRARMLLIYLPIAAAISIGMDYFVYRTPAKEAAREAKRNAHRPNIRL
jgi:hypothetical protein